MVLPEGDAIASDRARIDNKLEKIRYSMVGLDDAKKLKLLEKEEEKLMQIKGSMVLNSRPRAKKKKYNRSYDRRMAEQAKDEYRSQ